MSNGDLYKGELKFDKKHGKGEITWKDHSKYIGDWNEGVIHGIGKILIIDKGIWIEGEF